MPECIIDVEIPLPAVEGEIRANQLIADAVAAGPRLRLSGGHALKKCRRLAHVSNDGLRLFFGG